MNTQKPLTGCIVGISISESEDISYFGFDRSAMNRCIVGLCEALLSAGARLAFGHDWRPGGVMEAVAALAVKYFDIKRDAEGKLNALNAPILNFVAAPDVPFLSQESALGQGSTGEVGFIDPLKRLLEGVVDARQINTPGVNRVETLSLMRVELGKLCDVRVCIGGKLNNYSGRMPGVLEEALCSLRLRRPVLASSIFGGTADLIAGVMNTEKSENFIAAANISYKEALSEISELNLLTASELSRDIGKRLWRSTSIDQCIELIMHGMIKWRSLT